MLEPNSRRLLMESLQPPDGCRLDWAVGTTYTLDLIALLAAPVAFAFSDWQDRDGRPCCDPIALLKAVRQYAGQICLFSQAGRIHVPKTYQHLLASLEDSIVEAIAPKGGSFHPKMWFLRFVDPEEQAVRYRVLCSSRNMTFDRSWDTLLCLEGVLRDRVNAYAKNHPLGRFVDSLPGMSARPLSDVWRKRLADLAHEIRRVEFEIPEPFEEMDFWPLGLEPDEPWPFPERIDQMFVASPFVDNGLIEDLQEWHAPLQLLSRPESLARLSPETLATVSQSWTLDDAANPEPGDSESEAVAAGGADDAVPAAADLPLVGLHAKVYVLDEGWNARVLTGSANATRAAFHRNVEFLVELRGKKSRCGVSAILGNKSKRDAHHPSSLSDLLQPFVPQPGEAEPDTQVEAFERQVDQLAKSLSATSPIAECHDATSEGTYGVRLLPTKPQSVTLPDDWNIQVRPVSLPGSQLFAVQLAAPVWTEVNQLSLLGLTSFFVFQVQSNTLQISRSFVLNIPLVNAPPARHEAILRELLSNREKVLRFLLLLLLDTGARDMSQVLDTPKRGETPYEFMSSLFGTTFFESLVKTLERDPERLDQVASVIKDLRQTESGRQLLPVDLDAIWDPIWAVRIRQIERHERRQARL